MSAQSVASQFPGVEPVRRSPGVSPAPAAVHFGGSRSLPSSFVPLVRRVVAAVQASGSAVRVGCAVGADEAVVAAAAASSLVVFAAFAPGGVGAFGGSAVRGVQAAAARGVPVRWLAGGPLSIPLVGRLSRRSQAALAGCSASVFFLASASSAGSLAVAAHAAAAGQPVFAFACGFSGAPALLRGQAGRWVAASFADLPCWRWSPAAVQARLF